MRPSRGWRFRIQDMLDAIARIESYTIDISFEELIADRKTLEAVQLNFIIIGEAAAHVPPDIVSKFQEVPWLDMRDMRNFVAHVYWGVSPQKLWETIKNDLPPLVPLLEEVLKSTSEAN
jgi:uncharacterized protein with HEPN domain